MDNVTNVLYYVMENRRESGMSTMADWDDFLTHDNFYLAWQRTLRSSHFHNKDRLALRIYEANLTTNLDYLIASIREHSYEPSPAERIYLPKRAGTARSIPVLTMSDRLVYQALANIVLDTSKDIFETIVEGYVFAHLTNDRQHPFFIRRWQGSQGQYRRFVQRLQSLWHDDHHWIVQADIASFYDSIDHALLCHHLQNRFHHTDPFIDLFSACLRTWSAHDNDTYLSRGLPQGYEASDYLATFYLLPVDEAMIGRRGDWFYLRYVDDIRILAADRDTAYRALHELDIMLKGQALIIQPDKTGARKVHRQEDLTTVITDISLIEYERSCGNLPEAEAAAEALFLQAWEEIDHDPQAETKLMFAIGRIPPTEDLRDIACTLLPRMPWRATLITGYLQQFAQDDVVIRALIHELQHHRVYAWYLATCLRALTIVADVAQYRPISQRWIADTRLRWYQRLAAVESLTNDHESFPFLFVQCRNESAYHIRAALLVAAITAATTDQQRATVIRTGIGDWHPYVQATAIWLFLEFPSCGVEINEFPERLDVHRTMIPAFAHDDYTPPCYIARLFTEQLRIRIPTGLDFRRLFGDAYDQAVKHLRRAYRYYDTDPTTFVTSLDNFNHLIAIRISEEIDNRTIPRDQYGNLLGALQRSYSLLSACLQRCHDLRSQSAGVHQWAANLGTWSQAITHHQKNAILDDLRRGYQEVVEVFAHHYGIPIT